MRLLISQRGTDIFNIDDFREEAHEAIRIMTQRLSSNCTMSKSILYDEQKHTVR